MRPLGVVAVLVLIPTGSVLVAGGGVLRLAVGSWSLLWAGFLLGTMVPR